MKLTTETNVNMLNDINYFKLSNPKHWQTVYFKDYKTYNTSGKQAFKVPEPLELLSIWIWLLINILPVFFIDFYHYSTSTHPENYNITSASHTDRLSN